MKPSMTLLDLAALVGTDADPTVAEVVCKAGFRLRIERVNALAPMLSGVSGLLVFMSGGSKRGATSSPPQLVSERDAKAMADQFQAVLLQAVTGTRAEEGDEWIPCRLVRTKAEHDHAAGRVWIDVIPAADQLRCYDALMKLHTGEGMSTLIDTVFRFAEDRVFPALARFLVRLRPVDGRPLAPGAGELQHGGGAGGDEGGREGSPAQREG